MTENNTNIAKTSDFEKEQLANLTSVEQLSYICTYCGKVNGIGAVKCVRCGKRRPKSEYLKAMDRVKNAQGVREDYIAEQARVEAERKEYQQAQMDKVVDSKVNAEREQIVKDQTTKFAQETDSIKQSTAREAVLRIIAAEQAAEDKIAIAEKIGQEKISKIQADADVRVADAESRANDALRLRNIEISKIVADERDKALLVAAEKLVSEREGIENSARDQIKQNKMLAEQIAAEMVVKEREESLKNASRDAALKVIAAENAADEKVKLGNLAAVKIMDEKIKEAREIAYKEANARFLAEKQAVERAADERIKAERAAMRKLIGSRTDIYDNQAPNSQMGGNVNYVQPLTIVPYVNAQHPLYQYNPTQVYKFVPSEVEIPAQDMVSTKEKKRKNKETQEPRLEKKASDTRVKNNAPAKKKTSVGSILVLLLSLVVVALGVLVYTGVLSFGKIGLDNSLYNIVKYCPIVATALSALIAIISLFSIKSGVRCITKVLAVLLLLVALGFAGIVVYMQVSNMVFAFSIACYALFGVAFVASIIALIAKKKKKEKKVVAK